MMNNNGGNNNINNDSSDNNNNNNNSGAQHKDNGDNRQKSTTPKKKRRATEAASSSSSSSSGPDGGSTNSSSGVSSTPFKRRIVQTTSTDVHHGSSPFDRLSDKIITQIIVWTSFSPSIHLVNRRFHRLFFSCFMLTDRLLQNLEKRFMVLNPPPYVLLERSNVVRRMFVRLHQIAKRRNCRVEKLFLVEEDSSSPSPSRSSTTATTSETTTSSTTPSTKNSTSNSSSDAILRFKQRLAKLRYPSVTLLPKMISPKTTPFTLIRLDYSPYGIAFDDAQRNLFVVDSDYDRVLVYKIKSEHFGSSPTSSSMTTSVPAPTTSTSTSSSSTLTVSESESTTTSTPSGSSTSTSTLTLTSTSILTATTTMTTTTPTSTTPLNLPITVEFCRELFVKGCPTGVAFNSINGNLIITCRGDQAIREFDPNKGILIRHFRCGGHDSSGRRGLSDLRGVALDADGSCVYVADYLNNRIQVFTNGGNLVKVLEGKHTAVSLSSLYDIDPVCLSS
eukprot:TRINITY_DN6218_c0_g1_i7.p1 TRINITY_DN6218_c0_g1~~TRINITY_DN6218_c0_g1_i7.p1  ORF type:complete len:504 (-),score=122.29 TRINITY_DN6218_c0_g1_i7:22-1533(-)